MKANHERHIITAGYPKEEIAEVLYNLVRKYGDKLHYLTVDCDGIYFSTIEYIK